MSINPDISKEIAMKRLEEEREWTKTMTIAQLIEKLMRLPLDSEAIVLVKDKFDNCTAVADVHDVYPGKDGLIHVSLRHRRLVVLP